MKKKQQTICLLLALLCLALFVLSSCGEKQVKTNIQLVNTATKYTDEEKQTASDSIYHLLYKIAEVNLIMTSSNTQKVKNLADKIFNAVMSENTNQEDFNAFFTYLSDHTSALVSAYKTLKKENATEQEKTSATEELTAFYQKALSSFGINICSSVAYSYLLSAIEGEKDENKDRVSKYYKEKNTDLYNYYSQKLEVSKRQLSTFKALGVERFSILVKDGVFFFNLLKMDWDKGLSQLAQDFTSAEFLLFYKELNFSLCLTDEEWEVLFERLSSMAGDFGEFLKIVVKNNDTKQVGDAFNTLLALLAELQTTLQTPTVDTLMQGGEEMAEALTNALNESEQAKVKAILATRLTSTDYTDFLGEKEWATDLLSATPLDFDTFLTYDKTEKNNALLGLVRSIFYVETYEN